MATFGTIASAAPNILFDPARVDAQVQGFQRNQLMMQNAQQDQRAQGYERETTARLGLARGLVGLPEQQAAAQWPTEVARLRAAGLGSDLPDQFPGMDTLRATAASDITGYQRLQIDEKRRQTEMLSGMFGGFGGAAPATDGAMASSAPAYPGGGAGAAPAMPVSMSSPLPTAGAAPVAGGGVRAGNADAAAQRDEAMRTLEGEPLQRRLAEISSGRAQALTGLGPNTQYRAPDGVRGVYAGVPAAPPGVPVLGGGAAPASAPAGPRVNAQGFTEDQVRELRLATVVNPQGVTGMMSGFRRENQGLVERAADNQRQDARFAASQRQQDGTNRRAEESLTLQREAAERAARAAEEKNRRDAGPEGASEAERKAASYLERMQGAENLLQGMVRGGYDPSNTRDKLANGTPLIGNFLTSERGQQYLNAASEWARAKLRLESGAVIGDDEARQEARTYFPMPGDSPETIAQKQALRDTASSAIRRQAGRALQGSGAISGGAPASGGAAPSSPSSTPPLPPGFTVIQ